MIEYFVLAFFVAGPAAPKTSAPNLATQGAGRRFRNPVEITADKLEILGKRQEAVWSGNVKAKRGTTDISCDRLVAHYTPDQEISRIECLGKVEVLDGDRWAKGERADFDNVSGRLVVTGNPEAKQGPNHMRGKKVTFHVGRDTLEVEDAVTTFESSDKRIPSLPIPRRDGGSR